MVAAETVVERALERGLRAASLLGDVGERGHVERAQGDAPPRPPGRRVSSTLSTTVPAMTWGASSETSQPANMAGMLAAAPGTGLIALAARAEVTSWRRR